MLRSLVGSEMCIRDRLGDMTQLDQLTCQGDKFEVVLCNPPYLSSTSHIQLAAHTKKHEPELALFAEDSGMQVYKQLYSAWIKHSPLSQGGCLILEVASGKARQVRDIWCQCPDVLELVHVQLDRFGMERALVFAAPGEHGKRAEGVGRALVEGWEDLVTGPGSARLSRLENFSQSVDDTWYQLCVDKAHWKGLVGQSGQLLRYAAWYTQEGCSCSYEYTGLSLIHI
eukprot:TRINITY_DN16501_c0_g1_i1.p1 TRINITY_DN16501_c0_g1~~TRINITY_DN16501_c0_g1_i1.p1  ORF type:complete len:227 (-),score=60.19 TRINITY_DN16501_c0_g1_i1:131-811(-)